MCGGTIGKLLNDSLNVIGLGVDEADNSPSLEEQQAAADAELQAQTDAANLEAEKEDEDRRRAFASSGKQSTLLAGDESKKKTGSKTLLGG